MVGSCEETGMYITFICIVKSVTRKPISILPHTNFRKCFNGDLSSQSETKQVS